MTKWSIEFTDDGVKSLLSLDRQVQNKIRDYLKNKVLKAPSPKSFGKALAGDKKGLWRYRVGDYRILCSLEEKHLVVLVIKVAHRRKVYS
jgi:mRNA interferase RelE/StbE